MAAREEAGPVIDWITDQAGFDALAGEWDALLPADARPFDLHCWYSAWWKAFGAGGEMAVCTARRDGRLAAVLPLWRRDREELAMANGHSPVFRPLAADTEARDALFAAAASRPVSRLVLAGVPMDDPSLSTIKAQRGRMRWAVEPSYSSPIVDTTGDFDAWRAESKKRWGAPLERFRRKMGRDFDADFSIVEPPSDLERELEEGFAVEASGWKGEGGTAILSTPETTAFYRTIAAEFAARDELRLTRISLDGEVAAFDFCLLHRERLYLLKTGFDERFRRLGPGLVMRLSIIERCFESGLKAHELLGEESEWKAKFATGKRSHVNALGYPKSPVGSLRRSYRAAIRPKLKHVYRRARSFRR
jgi:CelD/BcsL family acetyltransferase involved in cellulose biosynthesis